MEGPVLEGGHFPCLTFLFTEKPARTPWSALSSGTCAANEQGR